LLESERTICRPTLVFHMGFLFFELGPWQIRESIEFNAPGATLLFARDDWRRRPFRPVGNDEDTWFYRDQVVSGTQILTIDSKETFVAIRHRGHAGTFGHTWTHQFDGSTLENYLSQRPLYSKSPEQLLPEWAVKVYRSIHEDLASAKAVAATS